MFKPIPGNQKFVVSLSQEFRDLDGYVANVPRCSEGKVELEMYGKDVKVCPIWISLLSHFEIYFTEPDLAKLLNVNFVPANIKFFRPISSNLPVFIRPVVINYNGKVYRVVPNYSRYAITSAGELLEVDGLREVNIIASRKKHNTAIDQYPCAYIYDPDRSGFRYVYVHRMVGMAWVKLRHNDFIRNPILNHKDGDKTNYNARNLEWCSFRDNSIHMYSSGLRTDNIPCKVREFSTGKVYDFASKSQAAEFMGLDKGGLKSVSMYVRTGKLVKGKYEFKLKDDATPWFYENRKEKVTLGRYLITVVDKDGNHSYYYDLQDFKRFYAIWNTPNVKELLKVASNKYPELKFVLKDHYHRENVQAYDLNSGTVLETKTITKMALETNVSQDRIRRCLNNSETWSFNGYAFRYKTDAPWNTEFVKKDDPRNKPLEATNILTGETLTLPSIRAACRFLGTRDNYWLRNCVEQDVEFKGWRFKFITEKD